MAVVTRPDSTLVPSSVRRGALVAAAAAVLLAGGTVPSAEAASPSSSAAPQVTQSGEPGRGTVEVWLDAAIPTDTPAGERVEVGVTIWDPVAEELSPTRGSYMRIHPATGSAAPEEARTRTDWPGHLVASVRVPAGGPGRVEVGFEAEECQDDGGCQMIDVPFANGGVGPPPGASRAQLVVASFRPAVEEPVAGRAVDLVLDVRPRAGWDLGVLALPDRLVATASTLRDGAVLATAELRRAAVFDLAYTGSMTIPDPGEVVLRAAMLGAPDAITIPTSTTRLRVAASAATNDTTSSLPADASPWFWIAVGLAVVVASAFVLRKMFADL